MTVAYRAGTIARNAMAYVLAGGRGSRLYELTDRRAKPAVFFGGKSRIIDFALSNALNSGIRRIGVATQYKAHSLIRHLQRGWNFFRPERNESFDILPASQRVSETSWYSGTADAVYQNIDIIEAYHPEYMVVLAGDHVYKMDYAKMLRWHKDRGAAVTLATYEVAVEDATRFGVIQVDEDERIVGFEEKPAQPKPIPGIPDTALASMGIYVFDADVLVRALEADARRETHHDFGKDILPALIAETPVYSYRFSDENKKAAKYWRDIGTLDAYYEANMDLVQVNPEFNLYDPEWPIRTHQPQAPPAKFVFGDQDRRCGHAIDSIISNGVIVSGSRVQGSILCPNVRVHSYCTIDQSILMPGVRVGRHARIRNAIIDRDVFIPRGAVIGYDLEEDRKRHAVTERGVVVVTSNDEPFIAQPPGDAQQLEQEADSRKGSA
ncbi:MAG: glucose-1-phosphate adenylyltransferase [Gemmatimonadota bacterium]